MKQLTGLDGSFLYMETPTSFGHVNGLAIYERPSADFDPYQAVYRRFASKVGELEPMRRRIVEVPLHLDHPYWIDDPDFDLDFHIRHMSLAPPGRTDQLADQIARIVGRPMDRTRPLWEVYVIEGLEDDTWALLTKYHHATIDGASGVLMMTLMNDLTPDAPPPGESPAWEPDEIPSDLELLRLTIANLIRNPAKAMRTQLRMVRDVANAAGITSVGAAAQQAGAAIKALTSRGGDGPRVSLPMSSAPPTPWNKSITAHRRFAMRNSKLSDLKRIKAETGGTLNDIVMAICAGALRNYLIEHDALPDRALRAMVPVSIRTGDEAEPWTNRVSGLVVDLPTHLELPLERVGCVPRGDGPGQAAVRAGAGRGAGRHPAVLVTGRGHRGDPAGEPAQAGRPHRCPGQRDHLQRPGTAPAALHAGLAGCARTSRCRRSPRAWASTSRCTATSTSSSSG